MDTIVARISESAARGASTVVFVDGDTHVEVPWADVHREALDMAAGLKARGIGPGDHVAILGPTSRPLVTAIEATWLAGATVVVLPLPMRMSSIEVFVDQTRARVQGADSAILLIDDAFAAFYEAAPGDPPSCALTELTGDGAGFEVPAVDPGSLAILQFTSGSTSDPKGVMLPHRALCANLDAIAEAAALDPDDDVLVSWLPLYHDMGLVGLLSLAMSTGAKLVQGAPQDFLAAPLRWMQWLSTYRGTATAGPNFSYVLATRALRRCTDTLDLSALRIALNGAEPVDADTVRAFIDVARRHGMRPGAVFPAFGMAEIAIAGTFPVPLEGLRVDVVDRERLEGDHLAVAVDPAAEGARELVKLGRPVPGLEIRIVDPDTGRVCADREVGELQITGTSLTSGYYRNPEATAMLIRDGWLCTGDLAYLVDGEMVMCGRLKDTIIVGGRNIYPQDVEKVVGALEGIRSGNVIAFGIEGRAGKEGVVIVAETGETDLDALRRVVSAGVTREIGVPPKDVVLVAAGSLPKTSSGKLQRARCRQLYLESALAPVPS